MAEVFLQMYSIISISLPIISEEENGNITFRNCEIPFFQSDGDLLQDLDGLLVVLQLGLDERRQLAHLFNLQANGGDHASVTRSPSLSISYCPTHTTELLLTHSPLLRDSVGSTSVKDKKHLHACKCQYHEEKRHYQESF